MCLQKNYLSINKKKTEDYLVCFYYSTYGFISRLFIGYSIFVVILPFYVNLFIWIIRYFDIE